MKKNNHTYILIKALSVSLLLPLLFALTSCNEEEFLNEVPMDFYAPENSYVTIGNFESALANFYDRVRNDFYSSAGARNFPSLSWSGTEMVYTHKDLGNRPNWGALLLPTNSSIVYNALWLQAYRIIYDANVIIERSDSEISQLNDNQKTRVQAEAAFFRAFAYRMLAHLYGGVPLVLEEVSSPKRDYVRASRNEVYEQCVIDFKFAAENLPGPNEVDDSRINSLAAYHYLSEVYIALGKWQEAITAATSVINHPATSLMTERFGTRANEAPDPTMPWATGGDVYWDLFRKGNQNRSTGNSEAIWVLQYAFLVPGGADGFLLEREIVPRLWQAKVRNNDGSVATIVPYPNTFYFGRGSGFTVPSHYFFETIWQKSGYDQDIRNSEYNIVRDFIVNNPASDHHGKWIFKDNLQIDLRSANDTTRNFYPVIAKASTPGKHPLELYHSNQVVPGSLTNDARETFRDQYVIRLAETYLLRAEAHLGNNDPVSAAADLNVVRNRANAPDVDPSSVDIDYILDERIRELHFEELYILTLTRLGKLVERAQLTPWIGETYLPHNNLWPIPFDDIEKNLEAELVQNPGY